MRRFAAADTGNSAKLIQANTEQGTHRSRVLPMPFKFILLQVAVMERDTGLRILTDEEVDVIVKEVEEEKEAAEAAKRGGASAAGGARG